MTEISRNNSILAGLFNEFATYIKGDRVKFIFNNKVVQDIFVKNDFAFSDDDIKSYLNKEFINSLKLCNESIKVFPKLIKLSANYTNANTQYANPSICAELDFNDIFNQAISRVDKSYKESRLKEYAIEYKNEIILIPVLVQGLNCENAYYLLYVDRKVDIRSRDYKINNLTLISIGNDLAGQSYNSYYEATKLQLEKITANRLIKTRRSARKKVDKLQILDLFRNVKKCNKNICTLLCCYYILALKSNGESISLRTMYKLIQDKETLYNNILSIRACLVAGSTNLNAGEIFKIKEPKITLDSEIKLQQKHAKGLNTLRFNKSNVAKRSDKKSDTWLEATKILDIKNKRNSSEFMLYKEINNEADKLAINLKNKAEQIKEKLKSFSKRIGLETSPIDEERLKSQREKLAFYLDSTEINKNSKFSRTIMKSSNPSERGEQESI